MSKEITILGLLLLITYDWFMLPCINYIIPVCVKECSHRWIVNLSHIGAQNYLLQKVVKSIKRYAKAIMSSTGTGASQIDVPVSSEISLDSRNRNNNVDANSTGNGK